MKDSNALDYLQAYIECEATTYAMGKMKESDFINRRELSLDGGEKVIKNLLVHRGSSGIWYLTLSAESTYRSYYNQKIDELARRIVSPKECFIEKLYNRLFGEKK